MHPDILTRSIYSFMCYPISLSLTILLTFMIVIRVALHARAMKDAMGSEASGTAGLWKTIVTMFIESYALHAISFIIDEALGFADNPIVLVSDPIFSETQVRVLLHSHDAAIIMGRCLILVTNRSSLHSSSFCGLPSGGP